MARIDWISFALLLALSGCATARPHRAAEVTACIALLVYPPNIDTGDKVVGRIVLLA